MGRSAYILLALFAGRAVAAPVIGGGIIDRGSVTTSYWCSTDASTFAATFVADGPEVTLIFTADVADPLCNGGTGFDWCSWRIDNVAVTTEADYLANLDTFEGADVGGDYPCLFGPADLYVFHDASPIFLDTFGAGVSSGWDLSDGGYYVDGTFSLPSGPTDLYDYTAGTEPPGSLGLGTASHVGDFATTRITVGGLVAGQTYVLSFWHFGRVDSGAPGLEVTVLGTERFVAEDASLPAATGPLDLADIDGDGDLDAYVAGAGDGGLQSNVVTNGPLGWSITQSLDPVSAMVGDAWIDVTGMASSTSWWQARPRPEVRCRGYTRTPPGAGRSASSSPRSRTDRSALRTSTRTAIPTCSSRARRASAHP